MEVKMDNPYVKVFYDKEIKLMKIVWLPKSEDGTVEEFIALNETILNGLEVTRFLSDLRDFRFSITPESQIDIVKYTSLKMKDAGIKKLAILMPKDLFAMVSVEQTVDETAGVVEFEIHIFESYEKALKWVLT